VVPQVFLAPMAPAVRKTVQQIVGSAPVTTAAEAPSPAVPIALDGAAPAERAGAAPAGPAGGPREPGTF